MTKNVKYTVGLAIDAYAVVHLSLPEGTAMEEAVQQAISALSKEDIEDFPVSADNAAHVTISSPGQKEESVYISIEEEWTET